MEEAILLSAENLFMEKGFSGTSTTMIAKDAGCNQALVHYYFRTKDKLFDAIFEKKIMLFISGLTSISNEHLSFEEKLKNKIEFHFDLIDANPSLPLFFFNEIKSKPERLKNIIQQMDGLPQAAFNQMNDELKVEIKKGNIRPMTMPDLLITLVSLNLMLFIGAPIIQSMMNLSDDELAVFKAKRKKENVSIILNNLSAR